MPAISKNNSPSENSYKAVPDASIQTTPPSINLPKGGGAIRGIGEKFTTNPATGTGGLSIPLPISQGRSGFSPQLTLNYDSGSGNGPFGLGWSLSLPSITRKTDKGLPQYDDTDESDVFILSGAEDLVVEFERDATGRLVKDQNGELRAWETLRVIEGEKYRVLRYRPRTEGLFSRIERWTRCSDGDTHWRSISKDNVTTLYGKREKYDGSSSVESRIVDPSAPQRVFSWLICQTYDDKGNAISYRYVVENADGVDVVATHEINRPDASRIANRYLKRVLYGNANSLVASGPVSPLGQDLSQMKWHFELVFDYDEGHVHPTTVNNAKGDIVDVSLRPRQSWPARNDAFSRYRSAFELRTYRRCKRVAMFHHFENEFRNPPVPDYLVRSLDFEYLETGIASYLTSVTSAGYVHQSDQKYLKQTLPPLQFEYSRSPLESTDTEDFPIRDLPDESLENVPAGTSSGEYQWVDLDGEGISGLLSEQANAWYFKANLGNGKLDHLKQMSPQPSLADFASGRQQLLDLAGDGQVDLVDFSEPVAGFYERSEENSWESFRSFRQLPNLNWRSPDIRFSDLTGDGLADILVTEGDELTWYGSLAEDGFEAGIKLRLAADENTSPYVVTSDPTQALFLADMSGDGLNDLVRIRNSEVCYWPNLGYGRFGRKIMMGNSPRFDSPDQFDPRRIHLADTDGSGVADIIYHGREGVAIYLNQAGSSLSDLRLLESVPSAHHLSTLSTVDLLGAGTICLVWSSSLPSDTRHSMKYIDLMKGQKPHLLIRSENNLGAETAIEYASSTRFYLQDKANGTPWITRLPFPVHVVTRVETFDRISRNRFTSTYSYHHGHFDGVEREFRGFGRVEQTDTEEFGTLTASDTFPTGDNINVQSHVPPVLTRTWYHTGVYLGGEKVSKHFAEEYYREPRYLADPVAAAKLLLDDTILPNDLLVEEEREACRALRGQMLRQEVYALDGKTEPSYPFGHPYVVTEQNFVVDTVQPRSGNRFGVFYTHPRETISFHYERNPDDPRISHTMTFETDQFGNVMKSASIGYKRRTPDAGLSPDDQASQAKTQVVYTENRFTSFISENDIVRNPITSEVRTYELTGYSVRSENERFEFSEFVRQNAQVLELVFDTELAYEAQPTGGKQRRLIEHVRTLYRHDDFSGPLPLGQLESLAIPFESYKLAFTPGLLTKVFSGKVTTAMLESEGKYRHVEGDANWWIPSGRMLFSPARGDTDAQELHHARNHFFLPCRIRDPFHTDIIGTETVIRYDEYDLLVLETEDARGNRVTAGERDANPIPAITRKTLDYRTLQPSMVMDPNRNRSFVSFDALGMVVGTAVSGKPGEMSAVDPAIELGDSLEGFEPDLALSTTSAHLANPTANPQEILKKATTRLIYDLFAFHRTKDTPNPSSPVVYSLVRETHESELPVSQVTKVQHSFSYSDGFGREIQKKIQAEPGPAPKRDCATGKIVVDANGQPVMHPTESSPRWVGTGWTVFNNKGKPVRQFEPFFTDTHQFELDTRIGVSSILFYDPPGRVVATLHPNHTYEKVVFNPWKQVTWDVNDTVLADPRTDADIKEITAAYFANLPPSPPAPLWQTWHSQRIGGALGPNEQKAAQKAAAHAETPTTVHLDSLGRTFLSFADNGPDPADLAKHVLFATRVEFDIEGNQRSVRDAIIQNGDPLGRIVMRYAYDMLGNRIHSESMEAGQRWMLHDVVGKPLYSWDSRDHRLRTTYDRLRRPIESRLKKGAAPEFVVEQTFYGDNGSSPNLEQRNLRTRVEKHNDQAGQVVSKAYDFKGNLLNSTRQLAKEYKVSLNWGVAVPLEATLYESSTVYDALDRPTKLTSPDGSKVRPTYNEANLVQAVEAELAGDPAGTVTPFVANIDYNAKGQRTRIDYGNGTSSTYEYDFLTYRLKQLVTKRDPTKFPDDCKNPPTIGWPGCWLQDLKYTYDPVGNITSIRDDAQQVIFFQNKKVEPSAEYTYDAVYRLTDATGREHLGQNGQPVVPDSYSFGHSQIQHPSDGNAMGTYSQKYAYDAVGNILRMQHRGTWPVNPGWTLNYKYEEDSQIEKPPEVTPAKKSNRLSKTNTGGFDGDYDYDLHGNMTKMPHLPIMQWDHHDQLVMTCREVGNPVSAEKTYYVYDSQGQRVRKVTENSVGAKKHERLYLGGFEVYRKYDAAGTTVTLERETLHVMDDKQRIAMVERCIRGAEGEARLIRYQLNNHLGTACIELDHDSKVISYEEYFPYGATSYQAVRAGLNANPKRYRFTGKERDEENGLYYHGARYYASWLGRWSSCDPDELRDGHNLYAMTKLNPIRFTDTTGLDSTETTYTSPAIRETLKTYGIPHLEQLKIEALNEFGDVITEARPDYFFADPKTNKLVIVEAKGKNVNQLHTKQTIYVPLFESDKGTSIRFKSNAESLGYKKGTVINISSENYFRMGSADVPSFIDAVAEQTEGKKVVASYLDRYGNLQIFTSRLEADKFFESKGFLNNTAKAGGSSAAKATTESVSKAATTSVSKSAGKLFGDRVLKAIPFVGAGYTLFGPGEAEAGERIARTIAGEIGIGPFDLEMAYDVTSFAISKWGGD
jgi:RHS repeat-associated protein